MKRNRKYINRNLEYIIALIVFVLLSVMFVYNTGIINSGYHLADDYEILEINKYINECGLFNAMSHFVVDDLGWRFRPFYIIIRVLRTFIFNTNYYSWHLFLAVETGIIVWASYMIARELKTSFIPSAIFSFIFYIGAQDELIWRLGPQENLALLLWCFSIFLIIKYFNNRKKIFIIMATLLLMCTMSTKESFLVLSPVVFVFMFYLQTKESNSNENINIFKQLLSFIKDNLVFIIVIIVFGIFSVFMLLKNAGLYASGYAGIDTSYTFGEYVRITLNVFIRDLRSYWIVLALIVLLPIYSIIRKKVKNKLSKQYLRTTLILFIFFGYSTVTQAILYGSSSMFGRYYLPTTWIIFFTLLVLENDILDYKINAVIAITILVLTIVSYHNIGRSVVDDAKYYAHEGKKTTELLEYIKDIDKGKDNTVLTDCSWYETNYSVSVYLQLKEGINEVYYLDEDKDNGNYKKIYGSSDRRIGIDDANIIITDDTKIDNYDDSKYQINNFSAGYVLVKK